MIEFLKVFMPQEQKGGSMPVKYGGNRSRVPVLPAGRPVPVSRGAVQRPVVATPRARVPELAAKQAAYNAWRAGKK